MRLADAERCAPVPHGEAGGGVTIQDELPIEEPEPAEAVVKLREADVVDALQRRYGVVWGNGQRYATAYGVRSHAGFDARRTADFVAMDLWPSGGLRLHGHEVKVSRSDWLRELKDPSKAAEFVPYMNCWWLVVSDPRIVRAGELPDDWGLMAMRGTELTVRKPAPKRDALAMPPTRLAALLRAVSQNAAFRATQAAEREHARNAGTVYVATRGEDPLGVCASGALAWKRAGNNGMVFTRRIETA